MGTKRLKWEGTQQGVPRLLTASQSRGGNQGSERHWDLLDGGNGKLKSNETGEELKFRGAVWKLGNCTGIGELFRNEDSILL